jgi:hypothetical protein
MLGWLMSADARSAARAELHRLGLDAYEPDDLLHDVAIRLLRVETIPDNPVGYARRALGARAIDLLRGERVRLATHATHRATDDDIDTDALAARADDDPGPEDTVIGAAVEAAIRRGLQLALAGAAAAAAKVWAVAAALTTVTLRIHPDVELPHEAPRPDADGDDDRADRWAALWLAGEVDVFADPDAGRPDDAALRQARSRKLREVQRLLESVAATVLGGDD